MKADYTRSTFKVKKHYSSVRMQQGRVQLDADWNEQMDITAHRVETETVDSIGNCGAPMDRAGFHLVKNEAGLTAKEKEIPENTIDPAELPIADGNFFISCGRYYVDGILCENEKIVPFSEQPDVPRAELKKEELSNFPGRDDILKQIEPPSVAGTYLAYIDVWSRHITALEDDGIREKALGGPDTATRTKTVWQVKLLKVGGENAKVNCLSSSQDADTLEVRVALEAWEALVDGPKGTLAAKVEDEGTNDEDKPCVVAPGAGYRRLENQLYRVEVHKGGDLGQATFKWSRDNGTVVAKWEGQDADKLTVSSTGRDNVLNFAVGQWVELIDDTRDLLGQPGILVQLKNVEKEGSVLTIDPTTTTETVKWSEFPLNPRVRRWDTRPGKPAELNPQPDTGSPPNPKIIDLEDGVQVMFSNATYRTGDYWLVPARTDGADVEWPKDENKKPIFQSPHGIRHHYCRLGLLTFDGSQLTSNDVTDCRRIFPPVTELTSLLYVGGDGQEAMPGGDLDGPLQVRVVNGQHPVAGAKVSFTVKSGGGTLSVSEPVSLLPEDDGIAKCNWKLGAGGKQKVTAELLDPAGNPVPGQVIWFNADLSIASEVAYNPANCPFMDTDPPTKNVQDAIDLLCPRITMVMAGGDGQEACVGEELPQALRVVVVWGNRPFEEGKVKFEVTHGSATVTPSTAAPVNSQGVAICNVTAGSLNNDNASPIKVTAKLVNPPGSVPAPPPVVFTARFVDAACVYVGSDVCPHLELSNGNRTVSAILDHFCSRLAKPVIKVWEIKRWDYQTKEFSEALLVDDEITAAELAEGLVICCDSDTPIDPATVDHRAVGTVSMELPSLLLQDLNLDPFAGYDPIVIAGKFFVIGLDGENPNHNILWAPYPGAMKMLADETLFGQLEERKINVDRLLVRLRLCSNFIWGIDEKTGSERYLDGGLFGKPPANGAIVPIPVGNDAQPGRNLETRFYITRDKKVRHHVAFIPVLASDFFKNLDVYRLNSLSRAFSLAVNREDPGLVRSVPPGFVLDWTMPFNPETASVLVRTVYPDGPPSPLRVAVPPSRARVNFSGLWKKIGENLKTSIPELEVKLARRPLAQLLSEGKLDAVFGPVDVLRSLRSDEKLGHHFGRPVVF